MLLLDTSFLIEFEDELAHRKMGPAHGVLAAHRRQTAAISIITLGEFAEGFADPRALIEFLAADARKGRSEDLERQVIESRHSLKRLLTSDQGGFIG